MQTVASKNAINDLLNIASLWYIDFRNLNSAQINISK